MADEANPEKLALGDAIKDLGWFPLLFAMVVGGPSILAILEQVLVNHQLVPALQWVVDGYNRVIAVLGAAVEPLLQPAINWVNARLGWSLNLSPVWRPVFALCMVFVMAGVRAAIKNRYMGGVVLFVVLTFVFLGAALLIGLFAAGPGWPTQGAVAASPVAMFGLVMSVQDAARGDSRGARFMVAYFGSASVLFFSVGAGLSFVPGLAQSGGLSALGGAIAVLGAGLVWTGYTRLGLNILGGFVAAGLILVADFALKALGAE